MDTAERSEESLNSFCFIRQKQTKDGDCPMPPQASRFARLFAALSRIHAVDWLTQRRKDAKNKGVERIEIRSKNSPIGELPNGSQNPSDPLRLCAFA